MMRKGRGAPYCAMLCVRVAHHGYLPIGPSPACGGFARNPAP
jgi:hypothetical protein